MPPSRPEAVISEQSFLYAFLISGLLALLGLVVLRSQLRERARRAFLDAFARELGPLEPGKPLPVSRQGLTFHCLYTQAGGAPSTLAVLAATGSPEAFTLTREAASDRVFKGTGVAREIQTGDAAFDREVYIESDSPAFVRELLGDAGRRAAVREMFGLGANRIRQRAGVLRVEWALDLRRPPTPAAVTTAAERLGALVRNLAAHAGELPPPVERAVARGGLACAVVGGLTGVGGVGLFFYAIWRFPLVNDSAAWVDSLKLSTFLFGAIVLFMAKSVWGTSGAHRKLLPWSLVALVGALLGGHGLVVGANGWLDASPPVARTTVVLSRRVSHGKSGTDRYVTVESWRPEDETEELRVGAGLYERLEPRQPVEVTTRAGQLGHEWVVTIRPLASAELVRIYAAQVEADPRNGDAYRRLAWAQAQLGRHAESVAALTKLLELDPKNGEAYLNRAWNHARLRDRENMLADLTRACDLGVAQACKVKQQITGGPPTP